MIKSIIRQTLSLTLILGIMLATTPQSFAEEQASTPKKKEVNDLDLKDLGYSSKEIKANPEKQKELDTRAKKLKTHQIMGLVTVGLMTATALTAEHNKVPAAHKTLGIASGVSYFTTAYFSLSAPEADKKGKDAWNVKAHKALAFLHFPLMILTPIAGLTAEKQIERGQSLHGLAKHKETLGIASVLSVAAAASLMVIDF